MRKAQKQQAEEILRLLARVHEGIKHSIETNKTDSALDMLAQCQESADLCSVRTRRYHKQP